MTAYCKQKRLIAINEIEKIVSEYGYIVDFKPFSEISLILNIEIEELNIDKLYFALKSYMGMKDFEELRSHSNRERTVFLNITFVQGTGDLIIESPAVPG